MEALVPHEAFVTSITPPPKKLEGVAFLICVVHVFVVLTTSHNTLNSLNLPITVFRSRLKISQARSEHFVQMSQNRNQDTCLD